MTDEFQENDVVVLLVDIPSVRLHRGEIGTIIQVFPPTRSDWGGILVEFASGTRLIQTHIDDAREIAKLNFRHERTLQEWAGSSRIFALVFTDIFDSTTLSNALGDERWIGVLRRHAAQTRKLMSQYDCHEIKMIGDSFMVVFRTALEALDFALAIEKDPGDERIKIRAGIHVGSARLIDDDMFGTMVNYTKRIESVQEDGGITLSEIAKTEITNEKAERHAGLAFQPLHVTLKGFGQETVWLIITPAIAARALASFVTQKLFNSK
jgi:class 3 adenylate cyclase